MCIRLFACFGCTDMEPAHNLAPPQRMAVAYARRDLREALSVLLEFDNRLMEVASKGQESLLKQMRLAWWREQIGKDHDVRPKGEPLLARLGNIEESLGLAPALQSLVDAWAQLVSADGDPDDPEAVSANQHRANAVFGSYASWMKSPVPADTVQIAGEYWAKGSIGFPPGSEMPKLLPGLKPLNLLYLAYASENDEGRPVRVRRFARISWHALTGL